MAAERAQRRWANAEELSYFDDALRRLATRADTKPNRLRRIDAVIKQAEVKLALGRHAEHIHALDDIRDLVGEIEDPQRLVAWHYWTGYLHCLTGDRPAVTIEHCRQAAAIAPAAGFDQLHGLIGSRLAQWYVVAGGPPSAIRVSPRPSTS